ncbi:MAG TPA: hypothetical protein VFV75_07200 [Candidatus Polarisedimenticolaceae bacterium]|nr:hypothetical protein [Candidatus Polarisedimenticolaceae bacterium]
MTYGSWGATALLLVATTSAWSAPASRPALERAFAFASAIESDAKDRAMAQAAVALEALSLEDGEQAAALADEVSGWQRGVIYAEIATWHAKAGRTDQARSFLSRAEEFRRTQEGWQGPRIQAHIGAALSALGDSEGAHAITDALAQNDRQYNGMAVVSNARLVARRSGFDAAMAEIKKAEQETDYEFALGRTSAYLELGDDVRFSLDQRLSALRAARATAEEVAVWSRADLLVSASKGFTKIDAAKDAWESLDAATSLGRALATTSMVRAGVLSNVASAWIEGGDTTRAKDILNDAAAGLKDIQAIDRPEMLARIAAVTMKLPDAAMAKARFDEALTQTAALNNARPRALAAVGVCRALARAGIVPDADLSARLDALRRGLRSPW